MKVSVSLPGEDIEFLDAYAQEQGLESGPLRCTRRFGFFARRSWVSRTSERGTNGPLPMTPDSGTGRPVMGL